MNENDTKLLKENERPYVSVVIPIFNSEKYLYQCVKSLLNQKFENFEIILIDDGSTDESGIICNDFEKRDARIRVVHKNNTGVSNSRNIGIQLSRGKYIMFVDSDDTTDENLIYSLIQETIKQEYDIVMSGYYRMHNGKITGETVISKKVDNYSLNLDAQDFYELLKQNYITGPCAKIFKTDVIKNITFDESMNFGEDLKFVFSALAKNIKICAISEAHYYYNFEPQGLTTKFNETKCKDFISVYNCIIQLKESIGYREEFLDRFINKRLAIDYLWCIEQLKCSRISWKNKYDYLRHLKSDKCINIRMMKGIKELIVKKHIRVMSKINDVLLWLLYIQVIQEIRGDK